MRKEPVTKQIGYASQPVQTYIGKEDRYIPPDDAV